MNIEYARIKEMLSTSEGIAASEFEILKSISSLTNRTATHSDGRDLVIRALAKHQSFGPVGKHVLETLVRATGLHPYLSHSLSEIDFEDRLAVELHSTQIADQTVILHSEQSKVLNLLLSGSNVVFSAPTSVGKSMIIDAYISEKMPAKAVIVVPTIALIDETRRRFLKKFGESCKVITHPSQKADLDLSNLYVLTQERVLDREDLEDVDFFVVDEFYKLNLPDGEKDRDRSIDLNLAFNRLAHTRAQFYLLGPNIQSISGISRFDYCFVQTDFATVAVDVTNFSLPTKGDARKKKLLEICKNTDGPTIVYCQSPAKAAEVTNFLIEHLELIDNKETLAASDWMSEEYHEEWIVQKALRKGIGLHHGGVPRALQQYFIGLFNDRKIGYLVCTSTIIEGVNTVAKNVIIYDRRKSNNLVDHFTYKNISGRAGRMNEYFVGNVFVLEEPPVDEEYSVDLLIENQDENTPLSLLLDLPKGDVSHNSNERLKLVEESSFLSIETIKKSRHVSPSVQNQIARKIDNDLFQYEDALNWRGIPAQTQLLAVFELVFDFLSESALRYYNIHSGRQLAWHINEFRSGGTLGNYVNSCIEHKSSIETISEVIERALRFVRNVVCYRLPRDIKVIEAIQTEILVRNGRGAGDYSKFAEQLEHLFIPSNLFALDEYGIPIQTAARFEPFIGQPESLDDTLNKLSKMDLTQVGLSSFEVELVDAVRNLFVPPT